MVNAEQEDYWNNDGGNRWVADNQELDELLAPFKKLIVDKLDLSSGDNVIDIGCGAGDLSFEIADIVGESGAVTGVDISDPLIDLAQSRRGNDYPQTNFVKADAAQWQPQTPADAIASRFGVMFFDDPVASFRNINAATKPKGKLSFVCWQSMMENEWIAGPVAAIISRLQKAPPPTDPFAPGPFALADKDRVRNILTESGWTNIEIDPWQDQLTIPGSTAEKSADFISRNGPARKLAEMLEADMDVVDSIVKEVLQSRADDQGTVKLGGAAWIVSATKA
ncbi:class I SAM-dependent methyltransferase [Hyphococcus sp. DH-69]|uniref:class I SAM-dependent methyltransferase n=1 Tax=Hyphococcus formosus TaxID=3143534 RepID=UPI00398A82AC